VPAKALEQVVEHVALLVELESRALERLKALGLFRGAAQERRRAHDAAQDCRPGEVHAVGSFGGYDGIVGLCGYNVRHGFGSTGKGYWQEKSYVLV
jgi:hypothetical protein